MSKHTALENKVPVSVDDKIISMMKELKKRERNPRPAYYEI